MPSREKWSTAKLAYTTEQRTRIMKCIHRLNVREGRAIAAAVLVSGNQTLPRPHPRAELRAWFRLRWSYLIAEYEKVLPHFEELPDEEVNRMVKEQLMRLDST